MGKREQPDEWERARRRVAAEEREERERRRSSMRTLMELRGRRWVIQPLLLLALAAAGWAITRLFVQ